MQDRRSFLKTSGLLTAASFLPGLSFSEILIKKSKFPPIGLQTFTAAFMLGGFGGNATPEEIRNGFKQIADIGVKEIETFGGAGGLYHGHAPKELATVISDLGMKWISHHASGLPRNVANGRGGQGNAGASGGGRQGGPAFGGQRNLRDNLDEIIADGVEGGWEWVVCASSAESTSDEIKQTTEMFARAGEEAKNAKMKFAYHNHQSEFDVVDGITAYHYVLDNTDKKQVYMQVDLGWATAAGKDPVEMFNEYPGRFPMWHAKDIDPETRRPCPIGQGIVDFESIFANAKRAGLKHFFVEQDGVQSLDGPASSIDYLNTNILG